MKRTDKVLHMLEPLKSQSCPKYFVSMSCSLETSPPPEAKYFDAGVEAELAAKLTGDEKECGAPVKYKLGTCSAILWQHKSAGWSITAQEHFSSGVGFWQWIRGTAIKKEALWLFSHDLYRELTLLGTWSACERKELELRDYIIDDPPVVFKFSVGHSTVNAVDTGNYWGKGIDELMHLFGVQKSEYSFFSSDDGNFHHGPNTIATALGKGVGSMIDQHRDFSLGRWKPTGAGLAWSAYRSRFMQHPIEIHADPEATALERSSYYGGMCNVLQLGSVVGPVYAIDCNSMYPFVMQDFQLPCRLLHYNEGPSLESVKTWAVNSEVIAHVLINSKVDAYPVRHNGKTLYCAGQFQTYLAGVDLTAALRNRDVETVYEASVYDTGFLFSDYVEFFYNLRLNSRRNGERYYDAAAKLMLAGLYGKFAQRGYTWIAEPREDVDTPCGQWWEGDPATGETTLWRSVCWSAQRFSERDEAWNSFPAISACVTARAREVLSGVIKLARPENVYYYDTDSLHVNQAGYDRICKSRLLSNDALGRFKLTAIADKAEYRNVKDYTLDEVNTVAGVKRDAIVRLDGKFHQERIDGARQLLHEVPAEVIPANDTAIGKSARYACGSIGSDGRTRPFVLGCRDDDSMYPHNYIAEPTS